MSTTVYLVKRGPREEWHRAPFHPVIVTGKKRLAKWECGWSGKFAWVWTHDRGGRAGGWLLQRWNGLDIDYGHVVRGLTLPDGTQAAFSHEHKGGEPWTLLAGSVWWDASKIPVWLAEAGVIYPPDNFSQQWILDRIADDGASGCGRERPKYFPEPAPLERWEILDKPRIPNGVSVQFTEGIGSYERPATGVVTGLHATLEHPNGRYRDLYSIRRADGTETIRYRDLLEQSNPLAVLVPGGVAL